MSELLEGGIEFATTFGLQIIAVGVVALLSFQLIGRVYQSYHDAGRERMGLYITTALQLWLLTALITALLVLTGTPLDRLLRDILLTTPIAPDAMVYGAAALLLTMIAIAWLSMAVHDTPTEARLLMHPKTTGETIFWVLVVAPTAGFCEEVLFRGMLLSFAVRETGDILLGIALSSLAFGALHYAQGVFAAIVTGVMGAMFAGAAIYTGSLWPCIAAHALYDMAAPFLFRFDQAQGAS